MKLQFLETIYSVCQLDPGLDLPEWASDFFSISRTSDELTIIIASHHVPDDTKAQHDFACFRVVEDLNFDEIGIIAGISRVLAAQKVPILSISTYNTDYFLVGCQQKTNCIDALTRTGYQFQ